MIRVTGRRDATNSGTCQPCAILLSRSSKGGRGCLIDAGRDRAGRCLFSSSQEPCLPKAFEVRQLHYRHLFSMNSPIAVYALLSVSSFGKNTMRKCFVPGFCPNPEP